jgi:hypothetical protein
MLYRIHFSGDIRKLYKQTMYMSPDSLQGLLNKVLFETILYFCRRGRENIRELESSVFEIKYDADGRKYIVKEKSEQTKNHQGTTNEDESDGGRMYATGSRNLLFVYFVLHQKSEMQLVWRNDHRQLGIKNQLQMTFTS